MGKRTTGVVRWFDGSKGYGYIDAIDGEDVFVHYSELSKDEKQFLLAGDEVTFFLEQTVRGLQATNVVHLN
ncbi:MAG: cold shock domain-containing protein [Anaerolineales bacterium]